MDVHGLGARMITWAHSNGDMASFGRARVICNGLHADNTTN
jgi:hypothetical protein